MRREIGRAAAKHGHELLQHGFTVNQVVHDYDDLCQAVTELAIEKNAPVSPGEFKTLNRCLDQAIADAVSELPGTGCVFTIDLPRAEGRREDPESAATTNASNPDKKNAYERYRTYRIPF